MRLFVTVVAARVRTSFGENSAISQTTFASAMQQLEAVRADAKRFGFFGRELEAELAIGELEVRSGRAAAGLQRLTALQETAQAKRYELIARKAQAASGPARKQHQRALNTVRKEARM